MDDPFKVNEDLRKLLKQLWMGQASEVSKLVEQFRMGQSLGVSNLVEQFRMGQSLGVSNLVEQHWMSQAAGVSNLAEQLQARQDNFYAGVMKGVVTWQKLAQPNQNLTKQLGLTEIRVASIAWDSSLTQILGRLQETNLLATNIGLAARLLEPSKVYTDFVEKTFQRIEQSKSTKVTKALQTSLHLAEEQLLTTTFGASSI